MEILRQINFHGLSYLQKDGSRLKEIKEKDKTKFNTKREQAAPGTIPMGKSALIR